MKKTFAIMLVFLSAYTVANADLGTSGTGVPTLQKVTRKGASTTDSIQFASGTTDSMGIGYISDTTGCSIYNDGNVDCDGWFEFSSGTIDNNLLLTGDLYVDDVVGDVATFNTLTGVTSATITNLFASNVHASGSFIAEGWFATAAFGGDWYTGTGQHYGLILDTGGIGGIYVNTSAAAGNYGIRSKVYTTGGAIALSGESSVSNGTAGRFENTNTGYGLYLRNTKNTNTTQMIYGVNTGSGDSIYIANGGYAGVPSSADFLTFASGTGALPVVEVVKVKKNGDIVTNGGISATGTIYAEGNITSKLDVASGDGTGASCIMYSTGMLDCSSIVHGSSLTANSAVISGDITLGDDLFVGDDIRATGTIFASGSIHIGGSAYVAGDITASTGTVAAASANFTGTATAGAFYAAGNATAAYYFGDGSNLTNVSGTDNTKLPLAGGILIGDATGTNFFLSGNSTAAYFFGDGSNLTGVIGTDATRVLKAGDTMTGPLNINYAAGTSNALVATTGGTGILIYGNHTGASGDLLELNDSGTPVFQVLNAGNLDIDVNSAADAGDISQTGNGNGLSITTSGAGRTLNLSNTSTSDTYSIVLSNSSTANGEDALYLSDAGIDAGKATIHVLCTSISCSPGSYQLYLDSSTTTGLPTNLLARTANAGAVGTMFDTHHDSASPAAADEIFHLDMYGEDNGGAKTLYSSITSVIGDPTDTTEDGTLQFSVATAGAEKIQMEIDGPNDRVEVASDLHVAGLASASAFWAQATAGNTFCLYLDTENIHLNFQDGLTTNYGVGACP